MTMLQGHANIVELFTSFNWWRTDPHDELVDGGAFCLAEPGRTYAVYLRLKSGSYQAHWFNPRDGKLLPLPRSAQSSSRALESPRRPDSGDWAVLLRVAHKDRQC